LSRFVKDTFTESTKSTIGVEFATKNIEIGSHVIKVQIWDTAGQERYRAITPAYYRGAVGALVVYDITKYQSFSHIGGWIHDLQNHSDQNVKMLLVGNKCDLDSLREVSVDDASNYAEQNNVSFLESSALNNHNVATAFLHLVTDIYETLYSKLGDLEKPEVPGGAVPIVLDAEPILPTEPPPVGQKQVPTKQEKKCCT
jgi:Ras-related protein Rab-11A